MWLNFQIASKNFFQKRFPVFHSNNEERNKMIHINTNFLGFLTGDCKQNSFSWEERGVNQAEWRRRVGALCLIAVSSPDARVHGAFLQNGLGLVFHLDLYKIWNQNHNFSKVGTGIIKNNYGSTPLVLFDFWTCLFLTRPLKVHLNTTKHTTLLPKHAYCSACDKAYLSKTSVYTHYQLKHAKK
jgi:hypothetical protein